MIGRRHPVWRWFAVRVWLQPLLAAFAIAYWLGRPLGDAILAAWGVWFVATIFALLFGWLRHHDVPAPPRRYVSELEATLTGGNADVPTRRVRRQRNPEL